MLRQSEWINYYGPVDEWRHIAAQYSTSVLSQIIRILVIAERELKWTGGSVAATIWLFREYQARPDSEAERLVAWVLRNRGNMYLPFGMITSARTLPDWVAQEATKPLRRVAHEEHHRYLHAMKLTRVNWRRERVQIRRREAADRKTQIGDLLAKITAMDPIDRLTLLAADYSIPLGAIPENLIILCLEAADKLSNEVRIDLARRIDRRQSRHWKELRARLLQCSRQRSIS